MADKVFDASAICAVVFFEPEAKIIAPRLSGAGIIAPSLLHYEVANVLVTKRRSGSYDEAKLLDQFRDFLGSDVELRTVDLAAASSFAVSLKLSIYDAAYLWLAAHFGLELVTLDKRLATAAAKIGIRT
jgi:predicted nucleic acid-binding protein